MRVVTPCGRECLVRRQSPVPTFTWDLRKDRSSCWPQRQVESKYFPLQRCESRLLPTHSRGFPTTIITACWCFQDILFKVTWKHLCVVDFKIKPPRRSQYVKCHLCKSKQGILIYFFFSNDLAFRKTAVSKTRDIPSSQQGERVLTVASFSMYSSGAPREARPISCNGRETGTDMAGVC